MDDCICNLSKGQQKLITQGSWVNLYIERDCCGDYLLEAIDDGRADMQINYCPICGRCLTEKD